MNKRLAVYGAGAIGGQIGSRLTTAGHDVVVIDPWEAHREAIARDGLTIHDAGRQEAHRPRVISPDDLDSLPGPIDILFLAVKSYDTLSALERVRPYLAAEGLVVSTQNSINEEQIVPVMGADRVIGGVILVNAVLLEPGHVTATQSVSRASEGADLPGAYVGECLRPAGDKAREVAAILNDVWASKPIDNLMYERWSKLANNTMMNPVSGISSLRSKLALGNADSRFIQVHLAAEVMRVAEAEGYRLTKILGDYTMEKVFENAEGKSDSVERRLAERAARVSDDATTSLLQDVMRGRKTEIDYFSGMVSKKGAAHGIPTPYCEAVTDVIHRIETGALKPAPETLQEVYKLARD
ncbi:MAG: 2-dehydropantoate 2-reductase [Dehalococcoidia bacterium]